MRVVIVRVARRFSVTVGGRGRIGRGFSSMISLLRWRYSYVLSALGFNELCVCACVCPCPVRGVSSCQSHV